ncbi:hypothetical protein [Streptomyces sp. NPDC058671]|uniref:hypothetical protein n=1 Tax=Streptomyces sp. NPDC058671 TaxID=3346590 RepID=UPI0036543F00
MRPERVLGPGDRVVVAATRRGLAELLGRGGPTDRPDDHRAVVEAVPTERS